VTELGHSATPLYGSSAPEEFALQAGKVQNLRLAAASLDGLVLPAGEVFSFWRHVPRPTRPGGFAPGRELREGCVVPSVGGGLCQLTNALYDCALQAGFGIVERHPHSRRLPGSAAAAGRDATVFWNYVDLRFRPPGDCQLEVEVSREDLRVRVVARDGQPATSGGPALATADRLTGTTDREPVESCETCGVASCFRHPGAVSLPRGGGTAWLLDAWWPEHEQFLLANREPQDTLLVPLRSGRWGVGRYRWCADGFATVREVPGFVLRRSLGSRRLADEGAARQRWLLETDQDLAARFADRVPYTATHLVVSQNLLPFLWRAGALGGRTFDVLMARLPLAELHRALDRAAARWPEAAALADFRADASLVDDESAALAEARRWVTPHRGVAALARDRAVLLDWHLPDEPARTPGGRVVFTGPALPRRGALEVREAARRWRWPLAVTGATGFWSGCDAVARDRRGDWLSGASVVVLPAWVENQPRPLLRALAAGLPVVASEACGLGPGEAITTVPPGDIEALGGAVAVLLESLRSETTCK
jgi:hypothetical protein